MRSIFTKKIKWSMVVLLCLWNVVPAYAAETSADFDMNMVLNLNKETGLTDIVEGAENAPVVIVEYASLTCPHCAVFYLNVLPQLREKYIKTGKVRFIFREFAWDPYALAGFAVARFASPIRYDAIVKDFFSHQEEWLLGSPENARDYIFKVGERAGLTHDQIVQALQDKKMLSDLNKSFTQAKDQLKIDGTPAFIINGHKYIGELSIDKLTQIINTEISAVKK